jgi:hypothetical protein
MNSKDTKRSRTEQKSGRKNNRKGSRVRKSRVRKNRGYKEANVYNYSNERGNV